MKSNIILLIDTPHPFFKEEIERNGYMCVHGDDMSKEEILANIDGYLGALMKSRFNIDKDFIDRAPSIEFIARVGAGVDHIDVEYAEQKDMEIITSPEGNMDSLGEHAMGLILGLLNHIPQGNTMIKKGIWDREVNRGNEIMGKTLGIIGYGNMGSAFAKRLSSFGVKVIAYDKYKTGFSDSYVEEVSLKTLQQEADFLSMHVPLTDETEFMISHEFIQSFAKDFYLINTARGQVVRTADLVKNLKTGKIKGAALDVLEYEEISYEGLKPNIPNDIFTFLSEAENVILSPHVAGLTHESSIKHASTLANKIIAKYAPQK